MLPVNLAKIGKKALAALQQQALDDAAYHERKARQARASAQMLKEMAPIFVEMMKPPKAIKLPRMSKKQLAKLQQLP